MYRRIACLSLLALIAGCVSKDPKTSAIPLTDTPQAVRTNLDKSFPDAKIKEVEKETYKDGTIHYEVELTTADGKTKEVELAPDGEILDRH